MPNVDLTPLNSTSPFRKVAMGTWKTAKDPTVYGLLEIDVTHTLNEVDRYSKKYGVSITPVHLVGKATALALKERPEINAMIRGQKIFLRKHVSLFYQVNIPGDDKDKIKKATLSGLVIEKAENLKTYEIAQIIQEKSQKIKNHQDKEMKKNLNFFKNLPWCLAGPYLDFVSWLIYGLNLDLSFLGVPKDPFGSVMITNVGGLGIDMALAPLCAYTRVPLLLTIGKITKRPWVIEDRVEIRSILPIGVTFDHRLIDGVHAAHLSKVFKACFEDPEKYLFS